MGFYRAAGDEERGRDLRIGTARQQLQDAQLGLSHRAASSHQQQYARRHRGGRGERLRPH